MRWAINGRKVPWWGREGRHWHIRKGAVGMQEKGMAWLGSRHHFGDFAGIAGRVYFHFGLAKIGRPSWWTDAHNKFYGQPTKPASFGTLGIG
jgi:hypothetical protein